MTRKKSTFIKPVLRDHGGDMAKKWYVEYSYRNPRTGKMERPRVYSGFDKCSTPEERYAYAKRIISSITEKLMERAPWEEGDISYQDELMYQMAADRWGSEAKGTVTIRTYLSEFMAYKKASINKRTYQTYKSKCRIFCEWCERNGYGTRHVGTFTQDFICNYLIHLAEKMHLSRLSVDKYAQILRTFFDYLIKSKKVVMQNPVYDIPKIGLVKDKAAKPIPDKHRRILVREMKQTDPQLHIVCMLEYYSAIRPNECRLLKIEDLDFDTKAIRVPNEISKNQQTETVSMPAQLYKHLINQGYDSWKNKEDYMFGVDGLPSNKPVGVNFFRYRFNTIRDRLGMPKRYKLYSFKHTGGVKLVEAGVNPWQLQMHFRHRSITTTENYIKNRIGVRSDTIENHFPDMEGEEKDKGKDER